MSNMTAASRRKDVTLKTAKTKKSAVKTEDSTSTSSQSFSWLPKEVSKIYNSSSHSGTKEKYLSTSIIEDFPTLNDKLTADPKLLAASNVEDTSRTSTWSPKERNKILTNSDIMAQEKPKKRKRTYMYIHDDGTVEERNRTLDGGFADDQLEMANELEGEQLKQCRKIVHYYGGSDVTAELNRQKEDLAQEWEEATVGPAFIDLWKWSEATRKDVFIDRNEFRALNM